MDLGREAKGGRSVRLAPLNQAEARHLGPMFAAIDPWARYPYPASALVQYLAGEEPGAPRYALLVGEETAGAAGLRLNWLRGPYLQFLAVLPTFQGLGIGALFLAWMEEQARARGERNLWVCTSDFNADALRFYARHGFEKAAVLDGLVKDGQGEILMRKQISAC
jgi:GNAT superfamily N-acetyltransferase